MELLNEVVRSKYNLENTLHLAHWLARGKDFYAYHTFLGSLYDLIEEGTDELVELGIALGYRPNFDSFGGVTMSLEDRSCEALVKLSANMLTTYMANLFELRKSLADHSMAVGLVAHVEELASKATKALYLVSATLEKE